MDPRNNATIQTNQPETRIITPPSSPKKSKRLFIIIGIILLILLITAAVYYFYQHSGSNSRGVPAGQPLGTVQGLTPTAGNSEFSLNCQPNAILVNPCRPWVGAAAKGNPGISGQTKPEKDAVSQFTYLEQLVKKSLDIYRDYHSALLEHNVNSTLPFDPATDAGKAEIQLSKRSTTTFIDINWHPSSTWLQAMPVAQGGDPTVNANIDKTAFNIKAIAPHKIFLTLWHETNLNVSGGTTCPVGGAHATAGTPQQYIAAYQNVYTHFKTDGVSNVVWVMNYSSYDQRSCVVPQLWPGNKYVDWVIYDTYSRGKTWDDTSGVFYKTLEKDNSSTFNIDSKPWGIGEFGYCNVNKGITPIQYYQSVKAALDANTYPRLKMYLIYADTGGPGAGIGCLTDYDDNGTYDSAKQASVNQLFNDPLLIKH